VKFPFIAEQSHEYSITLLCQALEVSESGYDAWKNRKVSQQCREDARLSAQIQQILSSPSPGLWQPTHSRGAQVTRDPLLTQAGRATHAAVGLVSAAEAFSQADAASVILAPALLPIISIGSSAQRSPTPNG